MSRWPLGAYAGLAVATVAAFFVTQHLKVSTPLIAGTHGPSPGTISPTGEGCGGTRRMTRTSFYLLHRADDVSVYVVDPSGTIVRTLVSSRHMRRGVRVPDGLFSWNGRTDSGAVAANGTYYFRVVLLGQSRTIELPNPVSVQSNPPHPLVTSVAPAVLAPGSSQVRIRLADTGGRGGDIDLYRGERRGRPRLVKSFGAGSTGVWNGEIHDHPAPPGTYFVGVTVTDKACNVGRFPVSLPPPPGTARPPTITVIRG